MDCQKEEEMTTSVKKGKPVAMAVEVIIDNSGSMCNCQSQVVAGLNGFIDQLATAILPAQLSITLFDDKLKRTLVDKVLVSQNPRILEHQYRPDHGTENIAHSVHQALEERLAPINARQKALVVVTDGLNISPEMAKARALVQKRQSEGWLIVWLGVYNEYGTGRDYSYAIKKLKQYAKDLGIPDGLTFAFADKKLDKVMPLAAHATLRFGATNDAHEAAFTEEERALLS